MPPRNTAKPKYETRPTPGSILNQAVIVRAMRDLKTPPIPWQRKAIRLLGEMRPPTDEERDQFKPLGYDLSGGVPRYRQVIASVPRQSGKSALSKGAIKARAEDSDEQLIYATAQTGTYALDHMEDIHNQLPDLYFTKQGGRGKMMWSNGSVYRTFSPNKKGGHGTSVDFAMIDEGWALTSDVLQGILPAMSARPLAQMLIISTMGDMTAITWNGLVKAGREATEDPNSTMAYIEYSAPEEEMVFDPSKWGLWMPALGLTVSKAAIQADMRLMEADPDEGRTGIIRAYGNITTETRYTLFPGEWTQKAWRVIEKPSKYVLSIDVNKEPLGASMVTGHIAEKGVATRMVEYGNLKPTWVVPKVAERIKRKEVEAVVADLDPGSATKEIEADLRAVCEAAGVPLVARRPGEVAADLGRFYEDLRQGTAFMESREELEAALSGAMKKPYRDTWLISRLQMRVDASPLLATVMAHGMAVELDLKPVVKSGFSWG